MYKVIVVDDEAASRSHICSIIRKKCPQYEVIGTAANGKEALEKVEAQPPDLLITDVKMPGLNGIELLEQLHEKYPRLYTVIISGYSEFEYAKQALRSGACDYILKPVVPSEMAKTLKSIAARIEKDQYLERKRIIQRLCKEEECDPELIARFFTAPRYCCAIIRRNGLPRRFHFGKTMETFSESNEAFTVYGRDEMEQLYLIPEDLLGETCFPAYLVELSGKMHIDTDYVTIVYAKESCEPGNLKKNIKRLYHMLDTVSVVGLDQMISLPQEDDQEIKYDYDSIQKVLDNLEYLLDHRHREFLEKELDRLYTQWIYEKKPQLWLEYVSRRVLYLFIKHGEKPQPVTEYEHMLEDAFFYAVTAKELAGSLKDIMFQCMQKTAADTRVDSADFVDSVEKYIRNHLADDLSLKNISRIFGISQTYLSKLFRKYRDESFSHSLTTLRMEKATALMQENPRMFIKDIAAMVGYSDQFYFSRIFRSCMGICPTDYMENIEKQRNGNIEN